MIYTKSLIYIFMFILFVISCGKSGSSLTSSLKKDAQTRSVLIIKNASKGTMQSIEIAKKSSIYRQEELPSGLDCIDLGFLETSGNREIDLNLVSHKEWKNKKLTCEINDYSKFNKVISGELNAIFILKK